MIIDEFCSNLDFIKGILDEVEKECDVECIDKVEFYGKFEVIK